MASPRDRFFVEGVHVLGETVSFAPDDARKIVTVLRGRSGERVHVIDSAGSAFAAAIDVHASGVRARLEEAIERGTRESAVRIVVAQAIPKGQKMDLIVEKATELGAAAIVPLRSDRVTGERTGEHKVERWQRIAKTAAQQSGRTVIPAIVPIADWDALLATFGEYDRVYVPWELADVRPLREVFEIDAPRVASVLFVIGPEGGFSASEVERAVATGATAISLGARILRTETVALAVLSAFAYARGEF
ncbi:MAG TPA: RsmE family RNA methyltransferase [Candidatus Lustribacter sp.]|nr:RsmE family RNA methyltransferase [Candidatus Lustribacter sp.]